MAIDRIDNSVAEAINYAIKVSRKRAKKIVQMRNKGMTFKSIGDAFGFTAGRARYLFLRYK